jgi:hypothetical protein
MQFSVTTHVIMTPEEVAQRLLFQLSFCYHKSRPKTEEFLILLDREQLNVLADHMAQIGCTYYSPVAISETLSTSSTVRINAMVYNQFANTYALETNS